MDHRSGREHPPSPQYALSARASRQEGPMLASGGGMGNLPIVVGQVIHKLSTGAYVHDGCQP